MLEKRVARSGPKGGPAQQISDKWRAWALLRLEALQWTPADLAREVEKLSGQTMTRAGISHVLTKAKRSGLLSVIEKALGAGYGPLVVQRPDEVAKEIGATIEPDRLAMMQQVTEKILQLAGSPEERELTDIYDELDVDEQHELLTYARTLRELRRGEKRRRDAVESAARRRQESAARLAVVKHDMHTIVEEEHRADRIRMNVAASEDQYRHQVNEAETLLAKIDQEERALLESVASAEQAAAIAKARQKTQQQRQAAKEAIAQSLGMRARIEVDLSRLMVRRGQTMEMLRKLELEADDAVRIWSKHAHDLEQIKKLRRTLDLTDPNDVDLEDTEA